MSGCSVCGKKLNIFNRGNDQRCIECLKGLTDLEAQKRINKDPAYKYIPKSRDDLPLPCDVSSELETAPTPKIMVEPAHKPREVAHISAEEKTTGCSKDKPNPLSREKTPFAYDLIEAYRKEYSTDAKEFTLEAIAMLAPDIAGNFADRWIENAREGDEEAQKTLAVIALLVPTFLRGAAEIKTPMPVPELRDFHMRVLGESFSEIGIDDPDTLADLYKFAVRYTRKLFAAKSEAALTFRKNFLTILRTRIRQMAEGKSHLNEELSGSMDRTYKLLGDLIKIDPRQ